MKKHSKVELKRYLTVFVVMTCLMSYSFAMLTSHAISYSDAVASVDRLSSLPFTSYTLCYYKDGSFTTLVSSDISSFPVSVGDDLLIPASSRLYLYTSFDDSVYLCLDYKYDIAVTVTFDDWGWFTNSLSYFTVDSSLGTGLFPSVFGTPLLSDGSSTYHFTVDFSDEDLTQTVLSSSAYDPAINSVRVERFRFTLADAYSSVEYIISPSFSIESVSVTRISAELKSNFLLDFWNHGVGMLIDTINIIASQPMMVAFLLVLPMVGLGVGLFRRVKNA